MPLSFAILVTQLNYLVNEYADDTNKLWTTDVTANIAIMIIMPIFRNFVALSTYFPECLSTVPFTKFCNNIPEPV